FCMRLSNFPIFSSITSAGGRRISCDLNLSNSMLLTVVPDFEYLFNKLFSLPFIYQKKYLFINLSPESKTFKSWFTEHSVSKYATGRVLCKIPLLTTMATEYLFASLADELFNPCSVI